MRHAEDDPGEIRVGRDPDELEREADAVAAQERELSGEVAAKARALDEATAYAAAARGGPPRPRRPGWPRWSGPPPTGARGWPG